MGKTKAVKKDEAKSEPKAKIIEHWPGNKPTGRIRRFKVQVITETIIALDESVLDQGVLPDNAIFGNKLQGMKREDAELEVVNHLAFNLICNDLQLSEIDGYANCPDKSADVAKFEWDVDVEQELDGD